MQLIIIPAKIATGLIIRPNPPHNLILIYKSIKTLTNSHIKMDRKTDLKRRDHQMEKESQQLSQAYGGSCQDGQLKGTLSCYALA